MSYVGRSLFVTSADAESVRGRVWSIHALGWIGYNWSQFYYGLVQSIQTSNFICPWTLLETPTTIISLRKRNRKSSHRLRGVNAAEVTAYPRWLLRPGFFFGLDGSSLKKPLSRIPGIGGATPKFSRGLNPRPTVHVLQNMTHQITSFSTQDNKQVRNLKQQCRLCELIGYDSLVPAKIRSAGTLSPNPLKAVIATYICFLGVILQSYN